FAGSLEYTTETAEATTLGILNGFVPSDGDAWRHTRNHLTEFFDRTHDAKYSRAHVEKSAPTNFYALSFVLADPPELAKELIGPYLSLAEIMGKRTAQLHLIMAQETSDPAFSPEPFNDF